MSVAHDVPRSANQRMPAENNVNVGNDERLLSKVAGGALLFLGLEQRSFSGLMLAAIGGAMLYRGFSGDCKVYRALGIDTSENDRLIPAEEEFAAPN